MRKRPADDLPKIAADLAAVFSAATLTADPTLEADPDPAHLDAYRSTGHRLASSLVKPQHRAVIRCVDRTRNTRRDLPSRALAVVHDRSLVVIQDRRGSTPLGYRLLESRLVDMPMAAREGQSRLRVACPYCSSAHDLPFHFLRRARAIEDSHPNGPLPLDPEDPATLRFEAFAETTGPFEGWASLFVRLTPWRAHLYRAHFGDLPPHDTHYLRLLGERTLPYALGATGQDRQPDYSDHDTVTAAARRVEEAHS